MLCNTNYRLEDSQQTCMFKFTSHTKYIPTMSIIETCVILSILIPLLNSIFIIALLGDGHTTPPSFTKYTNYTCYQKRADTSRMSILNKPYCALGSYYITNALEYSHIPCLLACPKHVSYKKTAVTDTLPWYQIIAKYSICITSLVFGTLKHQ